MPAASSLLRHARYRGRALALAFVGAVAATAGAAAIPPKTEAGVAALLGRGVGGSVDPSDFVWEASRGWWIDAFVGRRILFLARREGRSERELYRGLVTVTPEGRPLALRASAALTDTDLADEAGLVASSGLAAVRLDALGSTTLQSIEVIDLGGSNDGKLRAVLRDVAAPLVPEDLVAGSSTRRLVFEVPPSEARFELQGTDLVVSLGDGAAGAVDGTGTLTFVGGPTPPFVIDVRGKTSAEEPLRAARRWVRALFEPRGASRVDGDEPSTNRVVPKAPPAAPSDTRFPTDRWKPVEDHAGFFETEKKGALTTLAIDTRRFAFELVPGREAARSRTGHTPSGRARSWRTAEALLVVPIADRAGAWDRGALVAPLRADRDTLSQSSGSWSFGDLPNGVDAPDFAVQWAPEIDDAERERAQLCVMSNGHLALTYGTATARAMNESTSTLECAYATPAGAPASGGIGAAWIEEGAATPLPGSTAKVGDIERGGPGSYVLITRVVTEPSARAPDAEGWSPLSVQPDPTSIPAIYEASTEKLGTPVHVRLFMPNRFDWAIRAGDEEKQHRFGGTFERALEARDVERVFFATGLGVGKRQDPAGLKIAGRMGHRFHADAGLVAVRDVGLAIGPSTGDEPPTDATEGLVAARDGKLTAAARDSGPRQSRADICALPDGTVLLADAVFDNHEATASTLVDLGCAFVVSLDRGADRAAWSKDRSEDDLVAERASSVLFALARPFPGALRP